MEGKLKHYKYNIYGSKDSTDIDAVVYLDTIPTVIEDKKNLTNAIKKECGVDWNLIIARAANGIIQECTYPKASPDSLNNAIFNTYHLHEQEWNSEVIFSVKRNIPLAIYKTITIVLTYLTRTHYRKLIRPTLNYSFGIDIKLEHLSQIDFETINGFNQDNASDIDIWKTLPFYLVQNVALLNAVELYSKQTIVDYEPKAKPFLYRQEQIYDKQWLTQYLHYYVDIIKSLGVICEGEIISYNDQNANMKIQLPA